MRYGLITRKGKENGWKEQRIDGGKRKNIRERTDCYIITNPVGKNGIHENFDENNRITSKEYQ
jgi:hypothetical protein